MGILQNAPGGNYRPVYRRAWFWCLVLILAVGAWYLKGYFAWQGEQSKYDIQNAVSGAYWQYLQNKSASLEKQYREDTYGGATPEETLKLFVAALEKKDYTLASKYFIPEKQVENLKKMPEGIKSGGLMALVNAYHNGKIELTTVGDSAEIKIYGVAEKAPFLFRLIKNRFTNEWKIED